MRYIFFFAPLMHYGPPLLRVNDLPVCPWIRKREYEEEPQTPKTDVWGIGWSELHRSVIY